LLVARNTQRLEETRHSLEGDGHSLLSFDLNETDKIPEMVAGQTANFGPLSGVVHAAGVLLLKPLRVCRTADYESVYRINVVAAAQLLRGLTKRGAAAPEGASAVLVGSVMSVVGDAGLSAYVASKSGLAGLARAAALELAKERIRVNAVLPGSFESGMSEQNKAQMLPEQIQAIVQMHPLGMGRAEDIANAVAFFLADTARWITGTCLLVDGGYTAR
jgi:NAD(P)-dependent dehydrogenase (short-subunit alcohol dehydrogenase family)